MKDKQAEALAVISFIMLMGVVAFMIVGSICK